MSPGSLFGGYPLIQYNPHAPGKKCRACAASFNMALMDIPDVEATFRTANRILRPAGMFIFVVLHPCFETPFNVDNSPIVEDEEGNFVALKITRYGEEGKWYSGGTGMRGTLGSIHRMLCTYLNTLVAAGFTISDVVEPMRPASKDMSSKVEQSQFIPLVLIVKAGKRTCGIATCLRN